MTPVTPKKQKSDELENFLRTLDNQWGLGFPINELYSPKKVAAKSHTAAQCLSHIKLLFYRFPDGLHNAINAFQSSPKAADIRWKSKPNQEQGTLPGQLPCELLRQELLRHLEHEAIPVKQQIASPRGTVLATASPETPRIRNLNDQGTTAIAIERPGLVVSKEDSPLSTRLSAVKTFKQQKISFKPILPSTVLANQLGAQSRKDDEFDIPQGPSNSAMEDSFWRPSKIGKDGSDGMHDTGDYQVINDDAAQAQLTHIYSPVSLGNRSKKRSYETTLERIPLNKLPRGDSSTTQSRVRIRARGPELGVNGAEDAHSSLAGPTQTVPVVAGTNSADTSFSTSKDSQMPSFTTTDRSANTSFTSLGINESPGVQPLSSTRASGPAALSPNTSFKHASQHLSVSGPAQRDLVADHMEIDVDFPIKPAQTMDMNFHHYIEGRLSRYSPFKVMPASLSKLQLRMRYELTRVSLHTEVDLSDLASLSSELESDYATFWNQVQQHESLKEKSLPAKSSKEAWDRAVDDFRGILMSGNLEPTNQTEGPVLGLKLSPLQLQKGYRLGRKFGFDRYFRLTMPVFKPDDFGQSRKSDAESEELSRLIFSWLAREGHHMFGRMWSPFFLKNQSKERKRFLGKGNCINLPKKEVLLFATDGWDFASDKKNSFKSQPLLAHKSMSAEAMLEWLIPFDTKENLNQPYLKMFSRIALGLSTTEEALVFEPSQIEWRDEDIKSPDYPTQIMNDGCDVISPAAASAIVDGLKIEGYFPSAFQARIAGAKGLWIVDPCNIPYLQDPNDPSAKRITISPKQVKFENHPEDREAESYDADRLTFEVVGYSKPLRPAELNRRFIPILEAQGVPRTAFEKLFGDHLSHQVNELKAAASDGCDFRKWIHDNYSSALYRDENDACSGCLPIKIADQIIMLLEGGFNVRDCWFLKNLAFKALSSHFRRLEDRLSIPVGRSTTAYCVPDVTQTLEEGTVHLGFSGMFVDQQSGFQDTMLNDIDILVARSPANRPYDIQKVHAVVCPKLSRLKDVIVFSTRGKTPLAAKLAGGDYDGDKVWICWDPNLVEPFRNAEEPTEPTAEELGIIRDQTKMKELPANSLASEMIRRSFLFGATRPMLGICTNFYHRLCYSERSITSKGATWIAALLSFLVDQDKQGYEFTNAMWNDLKMRKDIVPVKVVDKMAYEDDSDTIPTNHILDQLKFGVIKKGKDSALEDLHNSFKELAWYDEDLSKLWKHVKGEAHNNSQIKSLIRSLEAQLRALHDRWCSQMGSMEEELEYSKFKSALADTFPRFEAISPPESEHPLITWWAHDEAAIWGMDKFSGWKLLKASAIYFLFHKTRFPWYMAGTQLVFLKLKATSRMRPIDELIYASLKPSSSFFRKRRERLTSQVEELDESEEDEVGNIDLSDLEDYF